METQVLERVKRMAKEDAERLYDLICIKQNENSSRSYCKVRPCNDFLFQIKDRIGILSKNNKRGPTKDPKDGGTGRKRVISLLQWSRANELAGRPAPRLVRGRTRTELLGELLPSTAEVWCARW